MPQKALYLDSAPNGPWVVRSKDIPKPGPGELLVKVQAAALNPFEWKIRAFNVIITQWPVVLGTDGAGVVEEFGEGVTKFKKGDKVLFPADFRSDKGAFQQYTTAVADLTAELPPKFSFDEGASVPLGVATAVVGLYGERGGSQAKKLSRPWEDGKGAYSGQPIVIFGGATSVGQYTIQFAKLSGFSPIITTASRHNEELLKSLGATHVIDRKADVVSEVKKIVSSPIEIVYDIVLTDESRAQAWEILAPGGTFIVATAPGRYDEEAKAHSDKHLATVFASFLLPHNRPLGESLYNKLTRLLEDGSIKPNRVEVLPNGLAGIPDGLQRLQENKVSGVKLIAHPQETV